MKDLVGQIAQLATELRSGLCLVQSAASKSLIAPSIRASRHHGRLLFADVLIAERSATLVMPARVRPNAPLKYLCNVNVLA